MNAGGRPRSAWTLVVPVITALAGALFATSATTARGTDLRGGDPDLPALIRAQAASVERRAAQNAALRERITAQEEALASDAPLRRLQTRQAGLERTAGLTTVTGPAVKVSLDDAGLRADSLPEGVGVDDVVVHQQDVQAVVNALWAAGAEAMRIQDQRVVSTSAVRCVGNTLILGGRVYSPPFVVTAIGDQDALTAGLQRDPAVAVYRDYADRLGLGYRVDRVQATFGPYTGTVHPVHARAVRPTDSTDPTDSTEPAPATTVRTP